MSEEWIDEQLRDAFSQVQLPRHRIARMIAQDRRPKIPRMGWLVALAATGVAVLAVWPAIGLIGYHAAAPSIETPAPRIDVRPVLPTPTAPDLPSPDLLGPWHATMGNGGTLNLEFTAQDRAGDTILLDLHAEMSDGITLISFNDRATYVISTHILQLSDDRLSGRLSQDGQQIEGDYTFLTQKGRYSARRGVAPSREAPDRDTPRIETPRAPSPRIQIEEIQPIEPAPSSPSTPSGGPNIEGLWVGSTSSSYSFKLTVLRQMGSQFDGSVECSLSDGSFRSFIVQGTVDSAGNASFRGDMIELTGSVHNRKFTGSLTYAGKTERWTAYGGR